MKRRIGILEDHVYWLAELKTSLESSFPFVKVDAFQSSTNLIAQMISGIKFNVIVVNGLRSDMSGPEVTRKILEIDSRTNVVGISNLDGKYEHEFISSGARYFLLRSEYSKDRLKDIVERLL